MLGSGVIDFDYKTYADDLAKRGASPEAIMETSITFAAPVTPTCASEHIPSTGEITVNVLPGLNIQKLNKALAHESQHRIDVVTGVRTDRDRSLNVARYFLVKGAVALGAVAFLALAYSAAKGETIGALQRDTQYAFDVNLAAYEVLYYFGMPNEKRARRAEKSALPILSIAQGS